MLDAAVFPHIFEAVLTHAPRASLLVLRAVNRELRARVDALLLPTHLTITAKPNGPPIVSAAHGRLPEFASWADEPADEWAIDTLPSREVDLTPVHVIDLERAAGLELVMDTLPSPVTVRFKRAIRHVNHSSGVTYFTPSKGDVFVLMEPLTALFSSEWRPFPAITGFLERIVINIWSHPGDVVRTEYPTIHVAHYDYNAEAVWVFHAESCPRTVSARGTGAEGEGREVGRAEMLAIVAERIVDMLLEDVLTTVVGVEALAEGLGDEEALDWIDPVLAFREMCAAATLFDPDNNGEELSAEDINDILGHIRFLSMEEYRAEVGDARADLETTWSGLG